MAARRGGEGGRARGRRSQAKSHVRCSAGAERIGSKSNAVAGRCICRDSRLKLPLRRTHINFYGRRKWLLHNARHRLKKKKVKKRNWNRRAKTKDWVAQGLRKVTSWLPNNILGNSLWHLWHVQENCKWRAGKKRKCIENRTAGFHFRFSNLSTCCCCSFKDTFGIKNNVP